MRGFLCRYPLQGLLYPRGYRQDKRHQLCFGQIERPRNGGSEEWLSTIPHRGRIRQLHQRGAQRARGGCVLGIDSCQWLLS